MSNKRIEKIIEMPFNKIPYYSTKVSVEETEMQINKLLKKFGITKRYWMDNEGKKALAFAVKLEEDQSKEVMISLDVPNNLFAEWSGKRRALPENQMLRMFYYSLKGVLEATKFGIMRLEDVFLSDTFVKTQTGNVKKVKEVPSIKANLHVGLLPKGDYSD